MSKNSEKIIQSTFLFLQPLQEGKNTRAKIEAVVQKELGGYLSRLEKDFNLIEKRIPLLAKVETKNVRYCLCDNFLSFWFRFIFKYYYMVEIGSFTMLREIIERDYEIFSGQILKRYFATRFMEKQCSTRIGGFWDRKGENEIDLITLNELEKSARIIEIKRQKRKIDMERLWIKGAFFIESTGLKDYQVEYLGLSMEDM